MKLRMYQVDAFASRAFAGNPAAVCPLETWLDDEVLQSIAQENNLSETAFFVPVEDAYHIRWFTPVTEVDLCGHATLASGYIVLDHIDPSRDKVIFDSRSGPLSVVRQGDLLTLDFPSRPPELCDAPRELLDGLGREPLEVLDSEDYFCVFPSDYDIRELDPDMGKLGNLGLRGVIVTSKGQEADFVSRFFAPRYGIDEDPATGSSHCALTPYWAEKLGKKRLHAYQLSRRGGEFFCEDLGDRVHISGRAILYMEGWIYI
jgi:predicted PhzF superfamily epimerase YddE/YHI9